MIVLCAPVLRSSGELRFDWYCPEKSGSEPPNCGSIGPVRNPMEILICPDCNTFEYTKTSLSSYPSSKAMLDMTAQYQRRLLQTEPKKKDQTGKEVEKPIKMWWQEVPRISVPICVTCSATMLPRDPMASHLSMHRCQL